MKKYYVHAIDIDFCGWSLVETGEHNAWGVIDNEDCLIGHCAMKGPADRICEKLNNEQPNNPRSRFISIIDDTKEEKAMDT
jgi:hypothetical protein